MVLFNYNLMEVLVLNFMDQVLQIIPVVQQEMVQVQHSQAVVEQEVPVMFPLVMEIRVLVLLVC